jgi:hypothetical protein
MPLLQTPRDRGVALILLLAVGVAIALTPFVSGLLGAGALYVIFVRPYAGRAVDQTESPRASS